MDYNPLGSSGNVCLWGLDLGTTLCAGGTRESTWITLDIGQENSDIFVSGLHTFLRVSFRSGGPTGTIKLFFKYHHASTGTISCRTLSNFSVTAEQIGISSGCNLNTTPATCLVTAL